MADAGRSINICAQTGTHLKSINWKDNFISFKFTFLYKKLLFQKKKKPTDVSTYAFNHTSLRVKDVEASIKFYTEVLGMK
jgi:catechol-2,3-dioxygenase